MHRIAEDGSVIRITGEGFYVEDDVHKHFARLAAIIARRRRSGARINAFVDLRKAATQSLSVTRIIAEETDRLYSDPSDRVAIIVQTMLLKIQLERVHKHQGFRIFLTAEEGERFLAAAPADELRHPLGSGLVSVRS